MQSQKLAMAYFLEVTDNYAHHDEKDFNNIKGLPIEEIIELIK